MLEKQLPNGIKTCDLNRRTEAGVTGKNALSTTIAHQAHIRKNISDHGSELFDAHHVLEASEGLSLGVCANPNMSLAGLGFPHPCHSSIFLVLYDNLGVAAL